MVKASFIASSKVSAGLYTLHRPNLSRILARFTSNMNLRGKINLRLPAPGIRVPRPRRGCIAAGRGIVRGSARPSSACGFSTSFAENGSRPWREYPTLRQVRCEDGAPGPRLEPQDEPQSRYHRLAVRPQTGTPQATLHYHAVTALAAAKDLALERTRGLVLQLQIANRLR